MLGIQTIGIALHTRLAAEGQAGRDGAIGRPVRRLVERRHPQHRGVPQHDRDPDRDDRQPDADARAARDGSPAADERLDVSRCRRRNGTSGSRSTTRSPATSRVLDIASKMKENFLYNRYVMGQELDRARQPRHVDAEAASLRGDRRELARGAGRRAPAAAAPVARRGGAAGWRTRRRRGGANEAALWAALHQARGSRSARATSCRRLSPISRPRRKFINALLETGIRVHRATREFSVQGKTYPAGSFVVLRRRRRSGRTSSTCSSRRIIRTTSPIRARRRRGRTTTPAGRSRSRWASSSIASSSASRGRSRSITDWNVAAAGRHVRRRRAGRVHAMSPGADRRVRGREPAARGEAEDVSRGRTAPSS